jgi:UTP-glucose-1-phosphate uridylyltransferase
MKIGIIVYSQTGNTYSVATRSKEKISKGVNIERVEVEAGQELVYIDGVNVLREDGKDAYAVEIKGGKYYDCGNIIEYLKTNVEMGLRRKDINGAFAEFIKETAKTL